jgi:hypothetical protein
MADQEAKEALDEDIPTRRPEEMVDRRGLQKKRPKMEKRKQRDERKEAERQQKGGYKSNAKERASGNIQTQIRVYEGHPQLQDGRGWQSTIPLLEHRSIHRPHTVGMQRT